MTQALLASLLLFASVLPSVSASFAAESAQAGATQKSPRVLVHLLDYLAKDYGGAVANGKVINDAEYEEQLEFSATALTTALGLEEIKSHPEVVRKVQDLGKVIQAKGSEAEVARLAREIQQRVISISRIPMAPTAWPNLERGKRVYAQNCASCHGATGAGDGPAGAQLNPKPISFLDSGWMDGVSPFQAFNSIRLGIPGTGMTAQNSLSDQEIWDAAFYVVSIRHRTGAAANTSFTPGSPELALVSSLPDKDLARKLPGNEKKRGELLAMLRTHSGGDSDGGSLALARERLQDSVREYEAGKTDAALELALGAYLEGVEPIEPRLRAVNPGQLVELEARMAEVRSAIERKASPAVMKAAADRALEEIDRAVGLIQNRDLSPWMSFIAASAVLLREGFEAVIVILALLGVVRSAGSRRAALWVHGGWITAVACGVIAWFFSGLLIQISGAGRELLEAVISIFAVAVLLFVGFWLHNQTEIGRWRAFLHGKVRTALEGQKLFVLASISFVAVFREAFETVLFLRAIWLDSGEPARVAMGAGVAASFVAVIAMAWGILRFSAKVPVRQIFTASAAIMAALAVILTGKAFHAFQETGIVTATPFPMLRLDLLGVYPTAETFIPQLLIVALSIALWHFGRKPSLASPEKA